MFSARKYLKIRRLDSVLFGGPEVSELIYEPQASYIDDKKQRERSTISISDQHDAPINTSEKGNIWYEYRYDPKQNQIFFNSPIE